MNEDLKKLLAIYTEGRIEDLPNLDAADLFKLQFNPGELICIKNDVYCKSYNTHWEMVDSIAPFASRNLSSKTGWFYLRNAISAEKKEEIDDHIKEHGKRESGTGAPVIGKESVSSHRSLYFEYDKYLKDGILVDYEGPQGKAEQLQILINLGLEISYIIDTGGKSLHFGIILDEDLADADEYEQLVRQIFARLPGKPDTSILSPNTLERLPCAFRENKSPPTQQKLIGLFNRVSKKGVKDWVANTEVLHPEVLKEKKLSSDLFMTADAVKVIFEPLADWEEQAEKWCELNLVSVAKRSNTKWQIHCINKEGHAGGEDRNPSAVIFNTGVYFCASCTKTQFIFERVEQSDPFEGFKAEIASGLNTSIPVNSADATELAKRTAAGASEKSKVTRHLMFSCKTIEDLFLFAMSLKVNSIDNYFIVRLGSAWQVYLFLNYSVAKRRISLVAEALLEDHYLSQSIDIGTAAFPVLDPTDSGKTVSVVSSSGVEALKPGKAQEVIDKIARNFNGYLNGFPSEPMPARDDSHLNFSRSQHTVETQNEILDLPLPTESERATAKELEKIVPDLQSSPELMSKAGLSLEFITDSFRQGHWSIAPGLQMTRKYKAMLKISGNLSVKRV